MVSIFKNFFRKNKEEKKEPVKKVKQDISFDEVLLKKYQAEELNKRHIKEKEFIFKPQKFSDDLTTDSLEDFSGKNYRGFTTRIPTLGYYAEQAHFIGYTACGLLATNWLIENACRIPVEDALRKEYTINPELEELRKYDKEFQLREKIEETLFLGRVYGGALILFDVYDSNPRERERLPFNPDGVPLHGYKEIHVIAPEHARPVVTATSALNPINRGFNKPEYWYVGDSQIHKSHMIQHVPAPVSLFLLPEYNYFGMSMPQKLQHASYLVDRSFSEAGKLLLQKRLMVLKLEKDDPYSILREISNMTLARDNDGLLILKTGEDVAQVNTDVGDTDTLLMNFLQFVASTSGVPATKLLGIQPKGFNATGEFEADNYRMTLESIRIKLVNPILERHYYMLQLSLGMEPVDVNIQWESLDSQTAQERIQTQSLQSQIYLNYLNAGVVTPDNVRKILKKDKDSPFFGMEDLEDEEEDYLDDEDEEEELGNG